MNNYEDIKNMDEFKAFIKIEHRSNEVLVLDTDFAHDRYMDVYYELQEIFKEDKIPYGTAQKIFKTMDKLNWYGVEDVEMYEIFEEDDKYNLSELSNILGQQEATNE